MAAAALDLDFSTPKRLTEGLEQLTDEELTLLQARLQWRALARAKQIPPDDGAWNFFGLKSGRGFGKTLCGGKWTFEQAAMNPRSIWFVVAPTHEDLIGTCFYGPSGLHGYYIDQTTQARYPVIPRRLIKHATKSPPEIYLWNDSLIRGFSAETPERLRGPQGWGAWLDEVASWREPEKVWDNLIFGLRLGPHPRVFWTGTPKPKPFIKMLVSLPKSITISGSMYENAENLADVTYENVAKYEGTKIGRQEIYGDIIDPEEAGFVKRSDIRLWPATKPLPKFRFILMSLDTAFTEESWDKKEQTGDPTACTVWGLFEHERREHVMLLWAWEDYLGMPALIRRVKLERNYTYGDKEEPLMRPAVISREKRPAHQGRPPDIILIEDITSGRTLAQMLANEDVLTTPFHPQGMDKLSRLHACSPLFSHGRVWAVESLKRPNQPRDWAEPPITQLCTYVGEGSLKHDDLLDTATQALLFIMAKFRIRLTVRQDPVAATATELARLKQDKRRNPYDG